MKPPSKPLNIPIASPLGADQLERIRSFASGRFSVLDHPDLSAQADILCDFDKNDSSNLPTKARRLQWV
jgi:hypothetical protein